MHERLFPRWGAALFALLPLSEILYVPITGQTVFAAALASLLCAAGCIAGAQLAPHVEPYAAGKWLLALLTLWPLGQSFWRMACFLQNTTFPTRPIWTLLLPLAASALLIAVCGRIRCAMWALPAAWCAGAIVLLSILLTLGDLQPNHFQPPDAALLPQTGRILYTLLPASLILSLSLPKGLSGAAARGLSAGGALLALASLRAVLLLGEHTAALLPYPNFSAAGLAAVGDFARHGEVFFAVPLILCELGRTAALTEVLLRPVTRRRSARCKPGKSV